MAIRAITIDLYGTLVRDNNAVVRDICRRISQSAVKTLVSPAEVGIAWWRHVEDMLMSNTFYDSKTIETLAIHDIIDQFNSPENPDDIYCEVLTSLRKPIMYDDTHMFVNAQPFPLVIIANGDLDIVEDALDHAQIEADLVVCSSESKCYKPSYKIFEDAVNTLGISPDEILHVASSLKYDIAPAQRVGMNTCWLNRLKKPRNASVTPDIECSSLMDLKMLIK
jgi:2-haloalkanoic acid dehalogenase type II